MQNPQACDRDLSHSRSAFPQSWGIVGGGFIGLATALRLAELGQKVTVFEAAPEIGGLASSWQIGAIAWDKFYHVILLSDQSLRAILAKLELEQEIRWVTTRTGFFTDGKLHSLSSSLDFLRFKPLTLLQKFRLGLTILYASRRRGSLDLESIPVEQWLRKLSGRATFERIWRPLLKAKLGEDFRRTSALFIWSYIDRMYKARRSGMKRELFGYVPGGYQRILLRLREYLESLGVTFATSTQLTNVLPESDRQGLSLELEVAGRLNRQRFDRVIMTVANPIVSSTCQQFSADETRRLNNAEYLGVVCSSLLLDRPLAGYYVTNITDSWVPLTGIIEMGSIVDREQLSGNYLVYLPQYMNNRDPRFEESDDVVHARALETLARMYPDFSASQVRAIQTARAKFVMTLPTLNYSQTIPPVVTSIPGLYILNSSQITIGCLNVNEVIELVDRELTNKILPDAGVLSP